MAPQAERLIQPRLEVAVGRFHVAVFMRFSHIDPMAFQTIVPEQGLVTFGELLVAGQVIHRRRQAVASHAVGDAAGQMQSILKPDGQCLVRLGMAEMHVFPIGVGEDRMKQEVLISSASDRHAQCVQVDEVEGDHIPRMMHLGKLDLLRDAVVELPFLHPPLQRPPNGIGDRPLARLRVVVFLLEPIQESHRLQVGIGFQKGVDFRPVAFERIGPRAIGSFRFGLLAGECSLIPVFANGSFSHLEGFGNLSHGDILVKQSKHPTGLGIAEHRKSPYCKSLR